MRPSALIPALLMAMAVLPATSSQPVLDGEQWTSSILGMDSFYGSEAWKYNPSYLDRAANPTSHIQNLSTSYFSALGLRVSLRIEICPVAADGKCAAGNTDYAPYGVSAAIPSSRGTVHALVRRESTPPSPTNPNPPATNVFFLDFDMDGSNNGDPAGRSPQPPADPGLQNVRVNIFRRVNDNPPTIPVGTADFTFTYEVPHTSAAIRADLGAPRMETAPDAIFRLFNDIGYDSSVNAFLGPLRRDHVLDLGYRFGSGAVPGTQVTLWGFQAKREVQPADGQSQSVPVPTVPFVPGVTDNETVRKALTHTQDFVRILSKEFGTKQVGADGRVNFDNRTVGQFLGVDESTSVQRALTVVAPLLSTPFNATACPAPCRGGAQYRYGATELVLPITDRNVLVDGFRLSGPGVTGGGAPSGDVRNFTLGINSLTVYARDTAGFPAQETRTGDAFALLPGIRNARPLTGGSLSKSQRDSSAGTAPQYLLQGSMPVAGLLQQKVQYYRVHTLLYSAEDAFYGLASADRGYVVELDAPPVTVPGVGTATLRIRSLTTNYEHPANDTAFAMQVAYETSLSNGTKVVEIPEAGVYTTQLTISSDAAGTRILRVGTSSGDLLPEPAAFTISFVDPSSKEDPKDRLIPGFEALLGAVALAVAWAARRRVSGNL